MKEQGEREGRRENQAEEARDERSEMRVRTDGGGEGIQGRCERRSDREKNTEAALPPRVLGSIPVQFPAHVRIDLPSLAPGTHPSALSHHHTAVATAAASAVAVNHPKLLRWYLRSPKRLPLTLGLLPSLLPSRTKVISTTSIHPLLFS